MDAKDIIRLASKICSFAILGQASIAAEEAPGSHRRETYLTWLRPFVLRLHKLVPELTARDIALKARDHPKAGSLPRQSRSVVKAAEKILEEGERARRPRT
jgi:hypothetical protein